MERYSKKREAILDCLRSTDSHPTAEWIYGQLKGEFPDLSLATVYRNLAQLKSSGIIRSVGVVAGHEHFDGTVASHPHAVCLCCGRVVDIRGMTPPAASLPDAERETGFELSEAVITFNGICPDCLKSGEKIH